MTSCDSISHIIFHDTFSHHPHMAFHAPPPSNSVSKIVDAEVSQSPQVLIADNDPSMMDIIQDAHGPPEAFVSFGQLVYALPDFQKLMPIPTVALRFFPVKVIHQESVAPVRFFGTLVHSGNRETVAAHPSPFMPAVQLADALVALPSDVRDDDIASFLPPHLPKPTRVLPPSPLQS